MASITWTNVVDHVAALSTVDADAQTDILAYVNTAFNVDEFYGESSPMLKLARIYLAAHFGTITKNSAAGASGTVTSESVGGISRSYSTPGAVIADSTLNSTVWGQALITLINRSPARAPLVL